MDFFSKQKSYTLKMRLIGKWKWERIFHRLNLYVKLCRCSWEGEKNGCQTNIIASNIVAVLPCFAICNPQPEFHFWLKELRGEIIRFESPQTEFCVAQKALNHVTHQSSVTCPLLYRSKIPNWNKETSPVSDPHVAPSKHNF